MSIKLVISGGDSFTYGSELPDDQGEGGDFDNSIPSPEGFKPDTPSKLCWANLVANKLNAKHINVAMAGRGNSYIARHVIDKLYKALQNNYKTAEIFVQIMWTFTHRRELAVKFDIQRKDSPWFPIDLYTCEDESKSDWFKKVPKNTENWKSARDHMHKRYLINKELGLVDFAKQYYSVVDDLDEAYSSLKEILLTQHILESHDIKYIFTYVNEHVMLGLIGRSSWIKDDITIGLRSFIKFDEWYKFPGEGDYVGFDDWAKANKYEYATSHPLEKAHEDAAELIYEEVKTITQTRTRGMGPLPGE